MKKMSILSWISLPVMALLINTFAISSVQAGPTLQKAKRGYVLRTCDEYSANVLRRKAREYSKIIQAASKKYDVDANLIKAVITAETCFRPKAVSHKGASGLMQLMPATAKRFGATKSTVTHNVHAGTRYLRWLLDRYDGSIAHAVAAYNSGEGTVDKHGLNVPYKETQRYMGQVLNAYKKLDATASSNSPVERTLTHGKNNSKRLKKVISKRVLPSCMTASRKLHRATYHSDEKGERTFYYKVKKNDSLSRIMSRIGVSTNTIKRYNDLRSSLIKPGQRLKVSECRLK